MTMYTVYPSTQELITLPLNPTVQSSYCSRMAFYYFGCFSLYDGGAGVCVCGWVGVPRKQRKGFSLVFPCSTEERKTIMYPLGINKQIPKAGNIFPSSEIVSYVNEGHYKSLKAC